MTETFDTLINSPKSKEIVLKLGYKKEDLNYLTKDELKAKIGDQGISKV